jgi:hypothetical protein
MPSKSFNSRSHCVTREGVSDSDVVEMPVIGGRFGLVAPAH